MNMRDDDFRDRQILRRALFGAESPEAHNTKPVTTEQVHERLLRIVNKPVKTPDGRVLVLRYNPLTGKFRVDDLTATAH